MGMNLWSGCHTCHECIMHFRSKEDLSIHPFYRKHYKCMERRPSAVETLSDYYQDPETAFDGYRDVFDEFLTEK